MLYKRLREIDVPEMMASIITETQGQAVGVLPRHVPAALGRGPARDDGRGRLRRPRRRLDEGPHHATTGRMRLNTECTPMERHARAVLHRAGADAEDRQALRVGGRRSESGIPLMATIQDFDWADEVLHAQIGREWYVPQFGDLEGGARLRRRSAGRRS